ncbi:RodZ domain-containing protein [Lacimicrobium alkaliphilum]|uniref:XRE family transcriptional regulator n=1 Tax=Lacimicrobium alkaliphilum TaxID=1526571 RepID=A0ABQ1R8K9_9ALTE|nr:RodZ domain-containing protein [Lacimicrobium alkaliphilum]GGD58561.1 XRE family transcriptional regulator [Lacimicrobium alkaliphilum]
MTDEQSAEEQVAGPGTLLKNARVEKGLSQEEVASRLNLRLANVQDLETEQFDKAISVTFIRGYLKAYAKLLDVPVDEVLEAYERLNTETPEPAKLQSFSRKMSLQANDDRLMLVSYLILGIILALVVVWWFQQSDSDILPAIETVTETTGPESKAVSDFTVQENDQRTPVEDNDSAGETSELQPAANPEPSLNTEAEAADDSVDNQADAETPQVQSSVPEQQQQPPANQMIEAVELVFEFSGECWVNIVDATGEAIAYGVKAEGRRMPISGIPPFDVTLGAPGVVAITYAGDSVDMSGFDKDRTASFTLPLAE